MLNEDVLANFEFLQFVGFFNVTQQSFIHLQTYQIWKGDNCVKREQVLWSCASNLRFVSLALPARFQIVLGPVAFPARPILCTNSHGDRQRKHFENWWSRGQTSRAIVLMFKRLRSVTLRRRGMLNFFGFVFSPVKLQQTSQGAH